MKKNLFLLLVFSSGVSLILFLANGAQAASMFSQGALVSAYSPEKAVFSLNLVNSNLNWVETPKCTNSIFDRIGCSCALCSQTDRAIAP